MSIWNAGWENLPKNSQSPTECDDNIRETKAAAERRMRNEHETYNDATGGSESLDWRHKEGSARVWYQTGAPANAPSSGALAEGHLWVDSDGGNHMEVYSGAAWIPIGIETRTTDPGAPFVGQIWLRTDV